MRKIRKLDAENSQDIKALFEVVQSKKPVVEANKGIKLFKIPVHRFPSE